MKQLIELVNDELHLAVVKSGYDKIILNVKKSDRPDLCEFQYNGAMAASKKYAKAPIQIANEIADNLKGSLLFSSIQVVAPGFINLKVDNDFLSKYLTLMYTTDKFGFEYNDEKKTIILDYGGPNVAKPLHVGHLRSAVIGESIKRILRYVGNDVISDIHLGDWGLPIGLIITELKIRNPDAPYFNENYVGDYSNINLFTLGDLEEIYPYASKKSKENIEYKEQALKATYQLQQGKVGYTKLLEEIKRISVSDLKKNYKILQVYFDLWMGESEAQQYISIMLNKFKEKSLSYISEGALVVDIAEENDKTPMPPCILMKSDGGALYTTTDLATIVQREENYHPDEIIYVADDRQRLHFTQVFRSAKKAMLVNKETELTFIGFGTVNGKDGKPFKTRDGGTMRLENLCSIIYEKTYEKVINSRSIRLEDAKDIANKISIAALKYGDLSNQSQKNYIFDIDKFISFEGNTGPYILYSIVRIESILRKFYDAQPKKHDFKIYPTNNDSCKKLMLEISRFNTVVYDSAKELAPNIICSYIYDLANCFNHFYHEVRILDENDPLVKQNYINILELTDGVLHSCINMLGFEAPKYM